MKNDNEDEPKKSYMLKNNVRNCIRKLLYVGFLLCN